MRNLSYWKITVASAVCIGGGIRTGVAAPGRSRASFWYSHIVAFEVGDVQLRTGDNITINEVRGTSLRCLPATRM